MARRKKWIKYTLANGTKVKRPALTAEQTAAKTRKFKQTRAARRNGDRVLNVTSPRPVPPHGGRPGARKGRRPYRRAGTDDSAAPRANGSTHPDPASVSVAAVRLALRDLRDMPALIRRDIIAGKILEADDAHEKGRHARLLLEEALSLAQSAVDAGEEQ